MALLLGVFAPAGVRAAPVVLELTATVQAIRSGTNLGPEIPVEIGENVAIAIAYEGDAAPFLSLPEITTFQDALLSLEIAFESSGLVFEFGPGGFTNSIMISNDQGSPSVSLADGFTVQSSDVVASPAVEGLEAVVGTFSIDETIVSEPGGGAPDLLIRQDALPETLDLESPGFLITLFTVSLEGESPSPPIDLADVQLVPEPGDAASGLAALGALAGLYASFCTSSSAARSTKATRPSASAARGSSTRRSTPRSW